VRWENTTAITTVHGGRGFGEMPGAATQQWRYFNDDNELPVIGKQKSGETHELTTLRLTT
jgi:hypothetical protein